MDSETDDIPKLAVETENIPRRSSNSVSEIQPPPVIMETPIETINKVENTSTPSPVPTDVIDEGTIKRVDSESKFGVMETVSLDLSMQEASSSESKITLESSESVSVQLRSLSLMEKQISVDSKEGTLQQRPHVITIFIFFQ